MRHNAPRVETDLVYAHGLAALATLLLSVVFGLIVFVMVLTLAVAPRGTRRTLPGVRGPAVRPQSDTRPMPPPAVARLRGLAA